MSVAAGPYFLVERSWWPRLTEMAAALTREVEGAGYALHAVERHGEKGFHRLARGFCSRPDSRAMRRHFLDLGDPETAARFRPSSMEAVRALGGDPLTLVTEMPLFITPGEAAQAGLSAMPVEDQMRFQWAFIRAGLGAGGVADTPATTTFRTYR